MSDPFIAYETGMQRLLEYLGREHARYAEALIYQQRLMENIAHARHSGDTETRRAERAMINAEINALAREAGGPVIRVNPGPVAPGASLPYQVNQVADNQRRITTDGGDYAEQGIDKRQGAFVADATVYGNVIGQQNVYYAPANSALTPREQRNRSLLLQKVRTIWITGLLEQSLAQEARIALDMVEQPDAVVLPLKAQVQELNCPARALAPGSSMITVFTALSGSLLILGAPGAGKTTLLLELTRDLIARAEQDEAHPIPVVFNLSSWAERRLPLADWLVDELNTKYDVPRKLANVWVEHDSLLLLLDGLDEVPMEQRNACAEAINLFRTDHMVPLVVCSREADYAALTRKLRLQGAVVVQPLTPAQIDAFLAQGGAKLAEVRMVIQSDTGLRELARTPMMLSVIALAYQNVAAEAVASAETVEERRRHLFAAYTQQMFQRRGVETHYTRDKTVHWLGWLARGMVRQSQTVFYIEGLQSEWLPDDLSRWQYVAADRLGGAVIGGLVPALVLGVLVWLFYDLTVALGIGMIAAVMYGLVSGLFGGGRDRMSQNWRDILKIVRNVITGWLTVGTVVMLVAAIHRRLIFFLEGETSRWDIWFVIFIVGGIPGALAGALAGKPGLQPRHIRVVETLGWSWQKAWKAALVGIGIGIGVGQVIGVVGGLGQGWINHILFIMIESLGGGLKGSLGVAASGGVIGALVFAFVGGLGGDELETRVVPNQGIWRSLRSALVSGSGGILVAGVSSGIIIGLVSLLSSRINVSLGDVLAGGLAGVLANVGVSMLVIGLISGLSYGGYACFSHVALRLTLWRHGHIPWNYAHFLDHCAERVFLRKVGGGYIFIHRMLLEYFASLDDEESAALAGTKGTAPD